MSTREPMLTAAHVQKVTVLNARFLPQTVLSITMPPFFTTPGLAYALLSVSIACVPVAAGAGPIDTPYLAGIHWYPSNTGSNEVEIMTGGRGAWVVDQALLDSTATLAAPNPWETPWVTSPSVDKTQPWAKASEIGAIAAKGHPPVLRLHPWWGVNIPYPGDPYTTTHFAEDCKAAAALMRNVHIWQIGNEANLNGEQTRWDSAGQRYQLQWPAADLAQAPELYAQTYLACRDKIHEVTPATTPDNQVVLMQPCSPGDAIAGTRYMSSDEFLARMIAAVPDKSKIDGFALHSYAQPGGADNGATGYMNDLRRQIAIIDQAGLGDRPIFITEFNKHMPNQAEANIGAKFITSAFNRMNTWNTGTPALWPAQPNHPLRGAAWFVYRGGAGWDDYSLQFWKTAESQTSPLLNPWYSYQAAATQGFQSGSGSGPVFSPQSTWWSDSFDGSSIDTAFPLPSWALEQPTGTVVAATGNGSVGISSSSSFQLAGIRHADTAFVDFSLEVELELIDAAPVAAGEANIDIRFRQTGSGGPGYSLTLYSNQSGVRPGQAWLRKTAFWDTIYKTGQISGGLSSGDTVKVQVVAVNNLLAFKVIKLPSNSVILDWSSSAVYENLRAGGIGVYTYNMRDIRVRNIRMGGLEMLSSSAPVQDWELYE